ncbi:MAG: PqqD family protein [Candidatus Eremiobacterota bacterium]
MAVHPVIRRNPHTAWRAVGPYTVLVPLDRLDGEVANNTLVLQGTGPVLWEWLSTPRSEAELAERLTQEFAVDLERAQRDVRRFVERLLELKALEPS